jgi:hypothetical protein
MKTKVIAFRVTEEQYDALRLRAAKNGAKVSDVLTDGLSLHLQTLVDDLRKEVKRLEAKAKRDAKKVIADAPA